jgi:hypothetical protein
MVGRGEGKRAEKRTRRGRQEADEVVRYSIILRLGMPFYSAGNWPLSILYSRSMWMKMQHEQGAVWTFGY